MQNLETQLLFLLKCVKKYKDLPQPKVYDHTKFINLPVIKYELTKIKKEVDGLSEFVDMMKIFLKNEDEKIKINNKKMVDVGGGNFIELDCLFSKEEIPDNFHFYYIENIKEVVIKINGNYVNFKLEKVLTQVELQSKMFNRLENCMYKGQCLNATCNYYHNPIDFPNKFMLSRNFYPTYGIKNCVTFGSKDEIKQQVKNMKFTDVLDVIQKSCFLILASGFIEQ
jgi:hypothetical protein